MIFSNVVEAYFVIAGLFSYNILFDVLRDSGVIYLPFIFVIVEALYEGAGSHKVMEDTAFTLKTMETKIYAMILAFVLCVAPTRTTGIDNMYSFARQCDATGVSVIDSDAGYESGEGWKHGLDYISDGLRAMGATGETIEVQSNNLMVHVQGYALRVPVMLSMVYSFSQGLSLEATKRLPCSLDYGLMSQELQSINIQDPALKVETNKFIHTCYLPAMQKGAATNDQSLPWLNGDTAKPWPGAREFMNGTYYGNVSEGYYSTIPLEGFQNSGNNFNNTAYNSYSAENKDFIGYPSCREWWQGAGYGYDSPNYPEVGLRSRLLKEAETFKKNTDVLKKITSFFDSTQTKEDELLYAAFFNEYGMEKIQNAEMRDYTDQTTGFVDSIIGGATRFAGVLGSASVAGEELVGASMVQVIAPIGQAIILFVLTAFLPLAYIVSKYGWKFIVGYHFFIASVLFWPYLWELCILVQQGFTETVFGGSESYIDQMFTNPSTLIWVNYLTDALFLAIPGLLSAVMTAAGMQVGQSLGNVASQTNGMQAGKATGAQGANKAKSAMSSLGNSGSQKASQAARATPKGQMANQAKNMAQNRFANRQRKA